MQRRKFLGLSAGLVASSPFASGALSVHAAQAQSKPDSLVAMTWGGPWAATVRAGVDEKFQAETSIQVVQDTSNPMQRITMLKVNIDNQTYDAVNLPDSLLPLAVKQGVLEKIDRSSPRLTNLPDIYPQFVHDYWIGQIFSAVGIGYDETQVKTPPSSFADLWNPEYRGRVVLPDINHSIGTYVMLMGALAEGKPIAGNEEVAFDRLKRLVDLDPVWSNNDLAQPFRNGEAVIGLLYKNQAFSLQDQGYPVKWVYPREGAFSLSWGWGIAKNTKNRDWVETYINLTLDPQGQTHFTDYSNYPGTNAKMAQFLSPEAQERVKFTDEERESLIQPDQSYIDERRAEWIDRWNEIVTRR